MTADTHTVFKAYVGVAIATCCLAVLFMLQVTLSFIGWGCSCGEDKAVELFAYTFALSSKY